MTVPPATTAIIASLQRLPRLDSRAAAALHQFAQPIKVAPAAATLLPVLRRICHSVTDDSAKVPRRAAALMVDMSGGNQCTTHNGEVKK
jgi:hypothetical protein